MSKSSIKSISSNKWNKYDYRIVILIALLALGSLGGAFQFARIVGLLFLFVVFNQLLSGRTTKQQRWVFLFFVLWWVYALLTLTWTPDREQGLKELMYYLCHFSLFFLLVFWAEKANDPLKAIILGWVSILIFTLPIAIYEIITYNHLPISRFAEGREINLGGTIVNQRFASVTFSNRNTYVVILAYCLPFIFAKLLTDKKIRHKLCSWLVLFLVGIVLIVNASRGGVLSLVISSTVFIIFIFKHIGLKLRDIFIFLVMASGAAYIILKYSDIIFQLFSFRLEAAEAPLENSRIYLWDVAMTLLDNFLYMGTGVGSESMAMATLSNGITAVHNMMLEVLMQYGLLIFLFFCIFIFNIFIKIKTVKNPIVKLILWCFLLSFIPLFIINSGYLLMPSLWLLLASLFVLGTNKKIIELQK